MTSGERNAIVRRWPVLEMREGARAPQRARAHPSHTGVLFSKPRPQRWHTTTSASESSEVHPEESDGATASQTQGLQGPEGPPDIPQPTVCAPGFHPVVIVPGPVTRS